MSRHCILALAILLGVASTPILAGTPAKAALSYEQNEDRASFIELVRKARTGDAEAQWQIGSTYANLGDAARALPILQAAAASGHPSAAALLGRLHEDGRGTAKNIDEARRWYLVAAEQGRGDAMAALGRLLLTEQRGRGAALEWFRKAAELGNTDGQYYLAWMLATDAPDDARAHDWFLKAARQGHVGAQVAVATQLLDGQGVAADKSAAAEWLTRAAATNDPVAHYLLARQKEQGGGADREAARHSYRSAARAGHREAQFALATLLAKSSATADQREAADWFEKARESGHKAAANSLGELYREAAGEMRQLDKARGIFQLAAEQGNVNAMYNLAEMQNHGQGGERDTGKALEWYTRAAKMGHERAAGVVDRLLNSSVKLSDLGLKGFWQ